MDGHHTVCYLSRHEECARAATKTSSPLLCRIDVEDDDGEVGRDWICLDRDLSKRIKSSTDIDMCKGFYPERLCGRC
jgi:hypothetical protein